MSTKLQISNAGLELIKSCEQFSPTLYVCPAGKPTIGWGHVVRPNETLRQPISALEGAELLARDVEIAEKLIRAWVCSKVELAQHEFDALVSLVFNIGGPNFQTSTLRRYLEAGNRPAAADQFLKWVWATDPKTGVKRKLAGLERRRAAERALFLGEPAGKHA